MPKFILKRILIEFHLFASVFSRFDRRLKTAPFLCVIVPIFDKALPSLPGFIDDFQKQTFRSFIVVFVSNGRSRKVKKMVQNIRKTDSRFIYTEIRKERITNGKELLKNMGKRRNYAMKTYNAVRYVFSDVDTQTIDCSYISKLYVADLISRKDIIICSIKLRDGTVLPVLPLGFGSIAINNYTFSRKIAKNIRYPTDTIRKYGSANDWRYFRRINKPGNTLFLDFVAMIKDNRRSYESMGEFYARTV